MASVSLCRGTLVAFGLARFDKNALSAKRASKGLSLLLTEVLSAQMGHFIFPPVLHLPLLMR